MEHKITIERDANLPIGDAYRYQIVTNTGETLGTSLKDADIAYKICENIVDGIISLEELCPDSDLSLITTLLVKPVDADTVSVKKATNLLRIVTHDGKFHADEVLAIALVITFIKDLKPGVVYEGAEFARISHNAKNVKELEVIEKADYVLDVGLKHDSVKFFDHHQMSADNTAAACQLVWDYITRTLNLNLNLYARLHNLVSSVSLNDTGKAVAGSETIVGLVAAMNEKDIYSNMQTTAFMGAVQTIMDYVEKLKQKSDEMVNTANIIERADIGSYGEILLQGYLEGMSEVINGVNTPDIKRVVWYEPTKEVYYVKIPNIGDGTYGLVTKPFKPADYMEFVHANGFLATAKTSRDIARFLKDNAEESE